MRRPHLSKKEYSVLPLLENRFRICLDKSCMHSCNSCCKLLQMARQFWLSPSVGSNVKEQGSEPTEPVQTDVESGNRQKEYLEGYAELAEFIASDNDFLLFRKFGALGARNLLYLQAEVQVLEAQLKRMDEDDRIRMINAKDIGEKMQVDRAARDWEYMTRTAHEDENGREAKKLKVTVKIRRVMKEYRMLVLPPVSSLCLMDRREGLIAS